MTRQSGVDSTHTDLGVWQSRNMATVEISTSDMFRSRVCCRIRRGLEEPGADKVTTACLQICWVETAWLQTCLHTCWVETAWLQNCHSDVVNMVVRDTLLLVFET